MKKTNRRPDGTEEVLEGDPEELRKYEQLEPDKAPAEPITEAPKKPGILHGAEVDGIPLTEAEVEWVRFIRNFPKLPEPIKPVETKPWPQYPSQPIWITSCSICGRANCQGECWVRYTQPWITYTYGTTTGTTIKVREDGHPSLIDVLLHGALEVKTNGN